jgi:hypothetical protein
MFSGNNTPDIYGYNIIENPVYLSSSLECSGGVITVTDTVSGATGGKLITGLYGQDGALLEYKETAVVNGTDTVDVTFEGYGNTVCIVRTFLRDENDTPLAFVCLGYISGAYPQIKPRNEGRTIYIGNE